MLFANTESNISFVVLVCLALPDFAILSRAKFAQFRISSINGRWLNGRLLQCWPLSPTISVSVQFSSFPMKVEEGPLSELPQPLPLISVMGGRAGVDLLVSGFKLSFMSPKTRKITICSRVMANSPSCGRID